MSKYQSHFAEFIQGLLDSRNVLGYAPEPYTTLLKDFDSYCINKIPDETILTRDLVLSWVLESEVSSKTHNKSMVIRSLGEYMKLLGINAYVLPARLFAKPSTHTRYIFTDDELSALFREVDALPERTKVPYSHLILPVLFRLIYTCGLRPKEARDLKRININLESGEVLITNSKKKKSRIIVMSDDMKNLCLKYDRMRQFFYKDNPYFFPGSEHDNIDGVWLNQQFKICWRKVNSELSEKEIPKASVYNLRHQFASYNVNRWLDEGKNMNAMLPRLRSYMGHHTMMETAVYIHLLPDNLVKNNGIDWDSFTDIIPEVEE